MKVYNFLVLGVSVLSGLSGHVGIAVAGIAIYLTGLELERGKEPKDVDV